MFIVYIDQTYVNWEVICIDDGSQDNTLSILNHYATLDERFKIISQSNAGVSVARNKALSQCQGEYICFVDSDDLIEPNFLITLLQLISHQADWQSVVLLVLWFSVWMMLKDI